MSSEALVVAVSEALEAVQAAPDMESVYDILTQALEPLGIDYNVVEIQANQTFTVSHTTVAPDVQKTIRQVSNIDLTSFSGHTDEMAFIREVLTNRRTIFVDDLVTVVTEALGFSGAQPIARRVMALLGVSEMIASPLLVDDEVVGILATFSAGALSPADIPVISLLAAQVALKWKAIKGRTPFESDVDPLRLVAQIGREAAAFPDLEQLLHRILNRLHAAVPGEFASLSLVEGDYAIVRFESFKRESYSPPAEPEMMRLRVGQQGIIGYVAGSGETLLSNDVRQEPYYTVNPRVGDVEVRSELAVPLRYREEIVGVLNLEASEMAAYNQSHVNLLEAVAAPLAAIIATSQFREQADAQSEELAGLAAVTEVMMLRLPLEERLSRIAEHTCRALQALSAFVHLIDDQAAEAPLREVVAHKTSDPAVAQEVARVAGRIVGSSRGEHWNDLLAGVGDNDDSHLDFNFLCLPIRLENQSLGALTLVRPAHHPFDDEERQQFVTFANLAAVAVADAYLVEENERRRQLTDTLNIVSRLVGSSLDLDEVLDVILGALTEIMSYTSASVMLFQGGRLEIAAGRNLTASEVTAFDDVEWTMLSTIRRLIAHRRPLVIPDTTQDDTWRFIPETEYVKSWIGVPLVSRGNIIGILNVNSDKPNHYQPEQGSYLVPFANQIATALDNAILFSQTEKRQLEARALYETTRVMVSISESDQMIREVLAGIRQIIPYDVGALLRVREQTPEEPFQIETYAPDPIKPEVLDLAHQHIQEHYRVLASSLPNRRAIQADIRPRMSADQEDRLPSRLSVPLLLGDRLLGMVEVSSVTPGAYDESDLRVLFTIANPLAAALENAALLETLRQRAGALEESDQLKDEVFQNISHELRNPLTFVRGYVQLLLDGDLGPLNEEQMRSLEVVSRKTDSLVRLVNDIVTVNSVSAETLEREVCDIGQLVQQSIRDVEASASIDGLYVEARLPGDEQLANVDPLRIGQVVDNLLTNALKFCRQGGTIVARVLDQGERVRVEIQDDGPGIASDLQELIFERFFQGDTSLTYKRQGVGLGLAISKQIVDAHGGIIGVESEEGQGSTFFFVLERNLNGG